MRAISSSHTIRQFIEYVEHVDTSVLEPTGKLKNVINK